MDLDEHILTQIHATKSNESLSVQNSAIKCLVLKKTTLPMRLTFDRTRAVNRIREVIMNSNSVNQESQIDRRPRPKGADAVARAFVACPRCGYFLANYRLIHDDFESSVNSGHGNWLRLSWSSQIPRLLLESYGCLLNTELDHYEGTCADCRRNFIYRGPTSRRKEAGFRIEIKPS